MKILFFFALLANIIFFLWEVNSGVLNPEHEKESAAHEPKQILLLSESEKIEGEEVIVAVDKVVDLKAVTVSSESKKDVKNNSGLMSDEITNRKEKNLSIADEKSVSTDTDAKDVQTELKIANAGSNKVIPNLDKLKKTKQTESAEPKSVQEEKMLVKKIKKESQDKSLLTNATPVSSKPDAENQKKSNQTVSREENLTEDTKIAKISDPGLLNDREPAKNKTQQEKIFCYQVGPFVNSNKLEGWRRLNKFNSDSLKQFNKEIQKVASFLVYYPAAATYAKSKENALMLEQKGIEDFWLFRSGELKGIVSLGLFIKEDRALSLKEKLVKSGLNVEIMQRYKTESVFYAQISSKDETFKDKVVISEPLDLSECE